MKTKNTLFSMNLSEIKVFQRNMTKPLYDEARSQDTVKEGSTCNSTLKNGLSVDCKL